MVNRGWAVVMVLVGCSSSSPGDDLPATWTLSSDAITVEVHRQPFSYVVKDATGRAVLTSLPDGAGDGYGATAWTTGTADIHTTISPGYFGFTFKLDPWHDGWHAIAVDHPTGDSLEVTLAPNTIIADPPEDVNIHVSFKLSPAKLRVEAHTDAAMARAWGAAFATPTDEGFLGLGERFTRTNFRGLSMYSWAEEGGIGSTEGDVPGPTNPYPNGEAMSYYPVPFFVSTKGYAFWLDTTWWNRYDLAVDKPDAWRVWTIAPTLAFEVFVPTAPTDSSWPYQLLDAFTARVGRPMVPPKWTLGPRRRINRGAMRNGVLELQAMRDLDLAITTADDTAHFQPQGVPDSDDASIRDEVAAGTALGYKLVAYFNSFFATNDDAVIHPLLLEGLADGYFLKDATGTASQAYIISGGNVLYLDIVDFTSPDATAWFTHRFDQAIDLGYAGWMYDFGEYVQADVVAASGMTGPELHNLYPVLYQKAAHDYLETTPLAGQWLTFVRSGYTGASQYTPIVWSGDPAASFELADGLPSMVRAAVNIGIAGVPVWGGDIGGYHCIADGAGLADGELLTRWIEMGSTTPDMHDEDACVGGDQSMKATIWSSADAQQAWATYARLHTRMNPYFYALACQAHASGAPIIRHMFLENPDHPEWAGVDDQYYIGPSLLAAPVIARNARQKTIDLPAGHWLDFQAQTLVEGGAQVTLDAPLAKLPLLLRDGALLPLLDPTIDTMNDEHEPGIVGPADVAGVYDVIGLLSTGKSAAFTLCDDDATALTASYSGGFAPPDLPLAASESDLATCAGCYLVTQLDGGLRRVRVSATGAVDAGGLHAGATGSARIRWDLYIVDGAQE